MKKLFITMAFMAFIGTISAQNSLSWEQDGKRFTINLHSGNLSITCFDNAGNSFTIYDSEYDIEYIANSGHVAYYGDRMGACSGKVKDVGSTHISYYGDRMGACSGKVKDVGSAHVSYYGDRMGSYSGNVKNISGRVR